MRALAIVAFALWGAASIPSAHSQSLGQDAQPAGTKTNGAGSGAADPYAEVVTAARIKRAKQEWAIFLDNVRVIYFAVGCNVLGEQGAQPLIGERFAYFTSRPWIQWSKRPWDEAAQQGLAKAKIPNACSFWRDNPEQLLAMRQAAQDAISRVIAGYNPPLATDEVPLPLSIK